MTTIRRALVSVSDKRGLDELGRCLGELKIDVFSTGGTARALTATGANVTEVSSYTGFPEMMDGRVKTLHPKVHGGILGRRGTDDDVMKEHEIEPIDLVVVNLYPFDAATSDPSCDLKTAIENIDIGGPAMIRSAAKNHADVAIVVDPDDYPRVIEELKATGTVSAKLRYLLASKAFSHTARYDGAISNWLTARDSAGEKNAIFPDTINFQYEKVDEMRYGENPHQAAAFYAEASPHAGSLATAEQIQGKAMSYNNVADADAALECVSAFKDDPACVIVKHANPCGVAIGVSILEAYDLAFKTDPTSAFGGIIAFNHPVDGETARTIVERQFVEVVIAPDYDDDALQAFATKSNIRVIRTGQMLSGTEESLMLKRVSGGLLVQGNDTGAIALPDVKVVSRRRPSELEMQDLMFAWKVVKYVKSNAIVYVREGATIGVGAGQMSRVYSARIAGIKAADENLEVSGSVMASDAFFPFRDGIDSAFEAGITAVIQPGGSMRDDEVIAAADEHDMAMVFTGMRHFRH